jgi:exodeoxyribonuclease V beta subunit
MNVINSLDPLSFPLYGTRLIEASAGTGKTYTIAALYVRLILGHGMDQYALARNLLPPDILVVTFTEAATKELRERIRERLSSTARYFRNRKTEEADPFLIELRYQFSEDQWSICAQRLELAAKWMDEAAVFTIHGWCNRMLQQHAFESGGLFQQELKIDDTELLQQVVYDYWRTYYYRLVEPNASLQIIFSEFKDPDALKKVIRSLIANNDPINNSAINVKGINALCESVFRQINSRLAELKAPWKKWSDEIKELLDTAVLEKILPAKNYNVRNRAAWIEKINVWASTPEQIDLNLGQGFVNLSSEGMALLVKTGKPPTHEGFEAIGKLQQHLATLPDLKIELIKHAVNWIRHRCDTEKQRLAYISFNDMLTRLDIALQGANGECFANIIREQYPIALIDEFQDTDPVQYRIFEKLYPANEKIGLGCFMIGDPKQAIYSFRGADIFTYLKARKVTMGNHYTLATNYRSTKPLVKAINQVFLYADKNQPKGAFLFNTNGDNPVPFVDVKAQGLKSVWQVNGHAAKPMTFWSWETQDAISLGIYRDQMAEVTASEIVGLLSSSGELLTGFLSADGLLEPLQPKDIAILVRTGKEAKIMRSALARRKISSVYLSERESIYSTIESRDVLVWLKALADPQDERKVRAALSTVTFSFSYQYLQHLALDETDWEIQLERFVNYHHCWQQEGILPALRYLIDDYDLHSLASQSNDGERCLTNLLHLAELLQKASFQLEGEQALIRYLAEAIADENDQALDENVLRLESDANLIKIITLHKSKGLEYPLVFLPFICSFREPSQRDVYYRYHNDSQALCIDLTKSDTSKYLCDQERLQEDVRLVYVAITRAKYACWLGLAAVKTGNTSACQLEKSAMGYLIAWEEGQAANTLINQLLKVQEGCKHIAVESLPIPTNTPYSPVRENKGFANVAIAKATIADHWWIASYSALNITDKNIDFLTTTLIIEEPETSEEGISRDEAEDESNLLDSKVGITDVHSLPKGAGPGISIHALLENCGRVGFLETYKDQIQRQVWIDSLCSQTIWDKKNDILAKTLNTWLTLPLFEGDDFCLAHLQLGQYQIEWEFLIGVDEENGLDVKLMDELVCKQSFGGAERSKIANNNLKGLLKGFIDLVFVHNHQYYILDYKFNYLGATSEEYKASRLQVAMLNKRYDLQLVLYLLALHRLLKVRLGASYDYDTHIGGGLYLFLRGVYNKSKGLILEKPPFELIEHLDMLFKGTLDDI